MTALDDLPPHLLAGDGPDPEAEAVVSALAQLFGAPRWSITNDREAEWCASKLRAAAGEIADAEQLAAEYRARIDRWLDERTRRARATAAWATAHLERWGRELHAADPKIKSRALPSGKVSSREGALEWRVVDEEAAIRILADEGLDELVVSKVAGVTALKAALRPDEATQRAFTPDGTVVEGLEVVRRPRTWSVKPS